VAADRGLELWEALIEAGGPHGLIPYGLEALSVLRIEKGHVVGAEFDGRATPMDLGFEKMISRKKDFIGRWAVGRSAFREPGRLQLVGLEAIDPKQPILPGAQLVPSGDGTTPQQSQGHVTSTCFSPTLQAEIALGLLADGRARHAQEIIAVSPLKRAGSARARSATLLHRSGGESAPCLSAVPLRWTVRVQRRAGPATAYRLKSGRGRVQSLCACVVRRRFGWPPPYCRWTSPARSDWPLKFRASLVFVLRQTSG
jgi:hypothetical protein